MTLEWIKRPTRVTIERYGCLVVAGLVFNIIPASPAAAETVSPNWWLPPEEQAGTINRESHSEAQLVRLEQSVRKFSTSDEPARNVAVDRAFASLQQGAASVHFASSWSNRERVVGGGLSMGAVTAYSAMGSGENYSETSSQYAGLDPYKFHGGSDNAYRFHGAGLTLSGPRRTSLQMGFSSVMADRLETRRASYIGIATRRFFGRFTNIERGGDTVGHGFDAGAWLGRFRLGYQQLAIRQDVSTRRLRLQWYSGAIGRVWLDYTRHRNALYQDHEDDRIMLTFQRSLGRGSWLPLYAVEEEVAAGGAATGGGNVDGPDGGVEGEEAPEEEGGFRAGYLLLGGAAAAALVASSGSSSQDEAPRSNLQHETARGALNSFNPRSVQENREYGAYIYRNPDGSYASSDVQQGNANSVSLPPLVFAIPAGSMATASWHTHGGPDPRFDNENFSPTDLESDRDQSIDGYLGTPAGQFKYHDVSSGQVSVIGTVNN